MKQIEPTGVSPLTAVDLEYAEDMRSTVKLQGTAAVSPAGDRLSVSVSPVVVPLHHPFASTEGFGSILSVDSQVKRHHRGLFNRLDFVLAFFGVGG